MTEHTAPDREVHVYLSERVQEDQRAAYHALMNAEERARYDRFALDRLKDTHLLARALVRTSLSRYADAAPESWRFEVGEHGKPEVVGAPGLRFNLSHADGLLACAVTRDADLGVDVEDSQRRTEYAKVARRFFAAAEVEALLSSRRRQRFFEIWTLKEATIKARGLGLPLPLKQFAFDRDRPDTIAARFESAFGESVSDWQWALAQPTDRHVLAVALARGAQADRRVRFFESLPLVEVREVPLVVSAASVPAPR